LIWEEGRRRKDNGETRIPCTKCSICNFTPKPYLPYLASNQVLGQIWSPQLRNRRTGLSQTSSGSDTWARRKGGMTIRWKRSRNSKWNLLYCHFIHLETHLSHQGLNPRLRCKKPAPHHLDYNTAFTSLPTCCTWCSPHTAASILSSFHCTYLILCNPVFPEFIPYGAIISGMMHPLLADTEIQYVRNSSN
jgi:hypothetical protein